MKKCSNCLDKNKQNSEKHKQKTIWYHHWHFLSHSTSNPSANVNWSKPLSSFLWGNHFLLLFLFCFVIAFNFITKEKPDLSCLTLNFFCPNDFYLTQRGKKTISSQQVSSRAISSSSLYFLFHFYKSPSESPHWMQPYLSAVLEKIRKFCGFFCCSLFAAISWALRKLPEI